MAPKAFDPARRLRDPKREMFCQEVVAGTPEYRAYGLAGFRRPRGNANRMLREPQVAARVGYLVERINAGNELQVALRRIRTRKILEAYRDVDRAEMFDNFGNLRPLDQLKPEHRDLIESIEPTKQGPKAIMPSKLMASAQLAKLDGLDAPTKVAATDRTGERDMPTTLEVRWRDPIDTSAATPSEAKHADSP